MTCLAVLATATIFISATVPAESRARIQKQDRSMSQAARHDTRQDLPMPHPSSRKAGSRGYHSQHMGTRGAGPQDISGGNGQMLTRQRRF